MARRVKRNSPRRPQAGAALLALLAVILMASIWTITSRLNEGSANITAQVRARNAEVLSRAKLALVGYVAAQAVKAGEDRPGALPCPEAAGYFDSATQDGQTASSCSLPKVGRFPWRTIGTEKLVDAAGEPLWYVVGPGWAYTSGTGPVINSSTTGQLTVDGVASAAVALIIAPGATVTVTASTGCKAVAQARASTGTPSAANYLECENSSGGTSFVTTSTNGAFNDQVMVITVADLMPAIEAAIANRIEREIVPLLKTVYADANWGASSTNPSFPFPAAFADPTTSPYQGQAGLYQGLLPFTYATTDGTDPCVPGPTDPRCAPTFVGSFSTPQPTQIGGTGSVWGSPSCTRTSTYYYCYDWYLGGTVRLRYEDVVPNVAKALRSFSASPSYTYFEVWVYDWANRSWNFIGNGTPASQTKRLASDGSYRLGFQPTTLPQYSSWAYYYVYVSRNESGLSLPEHSILSSTDSTTGWFVRNEWYRFLYYAIAPNHAPGGTLSCTAGTDCLQVTNITDPTKQRAVLTLMGRPLSTISPAQTRPTGNLQDYLDSADNRDGNTSFVQYTVSRTSNDRFISLSKNP